MRLWDTGPERTVVHEGCSSRSECNPVHQHHLWREKKELLPDITGSFIQQGKQNWIQQGTRTYAINVRHEWRCSLPSISCCWWPFSSTISHLLSLLQSVTHLICSLNASPCIPAILYCTTVLIKVLYYKNVFCILCLSFVHYLCEKYYKPITVQYYIADCGSWVPRLTLLDIQIQTELIHYAGDVLWS